MEFGIEGPIMEGSWYDPSSGDGFTVRDSYFEDNNLVVDTMDGRHLYYAQFESYVKCDEKTLKELKSAKKEENKQEVLRDLDIYNEIEQDEDFIPGISIPGINVSSNTNMTSKTKDVELEMIERALGNVKLPEIAIEIEEDKDFKNAVSVLKNMMGISMEKIGEYLIALYGEKLRERLGNVIGEYIGVKKEKKEEKKVVKKK